MKAEAFCELKAVGSVVGDTNFDVLGELLVELLVVLSVLLRFNKNFKALLEDVLLHDVENLVFFREFNGNVKGKIYKLNNTLF